MQNHFLPILSILLSTLCFQAYAQPMVYKRFNKVIYNGETYKISELKVANLIPHELIPAMEHVQNYIKLNRRWRNTTLIGLLSCGLAVYYIDYNGPYESLGSFPEEAVYPFLLSIPVMGFGLLGYVYTRIVVIQKTKKLVKAFNDYGTISSLKINKEASYVDFTINVNGLGLFYNF